MIEIKERGEKLMKTIKMMLLLTAVYICTSIFSSAYAGKECTKWSLINPCPIFGDSGDSGDSGESSESSKSTAAERKVTKKAKGQSAWSKWSEKCSNLVDCLKKD